jgi:DNA polymerase I-like protein with 3'-5' exonuclease and polymerase domains
MKSNWTPHPDQSSLVLRGGANPLPQYMGNISWRPPSLESLVPWRGAKRIGFDFETRDEGIMDLGPGVRRDGNYIIGFSYAIEDDELPVSQWPRFYVPVAHGHPELTGSQDDNVDFDARGWLIEQTKSFDGELVGMNLPYDLDWGMQWGCDFSRVSRFRDIAVADPLLYELHDRYDLEHISKRRGFQGKNESMLREAAREMKIDAKGEMWKLAGRAAGPYGEEDAVLPLQVLRHQEAQMAAEGIERCWEMECKVLPILLKMTRKGVRVDEDRLAQVEDWTRLKEREAYDRIYAETGVRMEVGQSGNTELLRRVLEAAGLDNLIGETATGKESFAKDIFAGVKHPVAAALARARQVVTVRNTFIGGVRRHLVGPDGRRRIHCVLNQIRKTDDEGSQSGVAYGRLSASHPNMQNQPGNSRFSGDNELGPMWRSIYLPEDGELWDSNDLKQQEPKWSFHYGALLEELGVNGAKGAVALCQRLTENPQLDTYEPIVDLAGVTRAQAKVIWLARAYGKGDGNLCEDLGLPSVDVTFNRKIYYRLLDEGVSKYIAKSLATVPVDSPEGRAAMAGGKGLTWKGAGPEGKAILDGFEKEMPFLKVAAGLAKDRAEDFGYVKLLSGRRCHFSESSNGGRYKYEWTNKAFNRIIQGTSAEQTKLIMIAVDEAGYGDRLMLQVHDEVASSVVSREQAEAIAEVMRHAVPMKMPTVVDIECGPSWGESMGVEYVNSAGKKSKATYVWGMSIQGGEPVYRGSVL